MSAKLTALRPCWLDRKRFEIGETIVCGDGDAAELISSGKATAADDATRRRVNICLLTEWTDCPDGESHRQLWALRDQVSALRAGRL